MLFENLWPFRQKKKKKKRKYIRLILLEFLEFDTCVSYDEHCGKNGRLYGAIDTLNKAFLNMKNDLFSTFEFQDGG